MTGEDIANRCKCLVKPRQGVELNHPQLKKLFLTPISTGTVIKIPEVVDYDTKMKMRLAFDIVWVAYRVAALAGTDAQLTREWWEALLAKHVDDSEEGKIRIWRWVKMKYRGQG